MSVRFATVEFLRGRRFRASAEDTDCRSKALTASQKAYLLPSAAREEAIVPEARNKRPILATIARIECRVGTWPRERETAPRGRLSQDTAMIYENA